MLFGYSGLSLSGMFTMFIICLGFIMVIQLVLVCFENHFFFAVENLNKYVMAQQVVLSVYCIY